MVARNYNQLVTPQKCCDEILRCIRSSNLHFTTQETPYSLYVTVRKKMINEQSEFESLSENELVNYELLKLKEKCDVLVQSNDELRNILESKDKENEINKKSVHDLSLKLEKAEIEIQEAIAENNVANTSLAAKGALANRLQRRTACKIQNGRQGAPKWWTGSGKVSTPRFLGVLSNFR